MRRFTCHWFLYGLLAVFTCPANAAVGDLLEMSDKLDQLDRMDLDEAIEKADRCTRARNFDCSEAELRKARKFANNGKDKADVERAALALVAERKRLKAEEDALAEQERQLALAEERYRRQQADAEARAEEQANRDNAWQAAFGAVKAGLDTYAQLRSNQRAQELAGQQRFNQMQQQFAADNARQQQRFAEERARIAAARQTLQRPVAQASAQAPAQTPSAQRVATAGNSNGIYTTASAAGVSNDEALRAGAKAAGIPLAALTDDSRGSTQPAASQAAASQAAASQAAAQREADARRERERLDKERAEQARLEKERVDKERAEKERIAREKEEERKKAREAEKLAAEQAKENMPEALAFCWQNDKKTYWWCDGRVDETIVGEKTREEQLKSVGCENARQLSDGLITLTRKRNGKSHTGFVFGCGFKLSVGDTGGMTWNRDIRKIWNGMPASW
ncbi:hypothetical protein VVD49_08415 [Uliginosibacterium sp. H3]|uniref:TolA protein n=1 Tax=Uliginosibacterium silvisoli TaxID=3114758 RepID=A0ABU6K282_9RHOO|nr:hypothetical protein [Uliginosibacterium sp. H3]